MYTFTHTVAAKVFVWKNDEQCEILCSIELPSEKTAREFLRITISLALASKLYVRVHGELSVTSRATATATA